MSDELTVRVQSASGAELLTLARSVALLEQLDQTQRARVLRYLNHRYQDAPEQHCPDCSCEAYRNL